MKHTLALLSVLSAGLVCLPACKPKVTPHRPQAASEYAECYIESYGRQYDSVPRNVIALDLYSEGLTLNENHKMQGSGNNLYISDIFLSDEALDALLRAAGGEPVLTDTLRFRCDGTAEEYTFLPGKDFEGNPTGIYLLSIEDAAITAIQVVDSGAFVIAQTDDRLLLWQGTFHYSVKEAGNTRPTHYTYTARFEGISDIVHEETD